MKHIIMLSHNHTVCRCCFQIIKLCCKFLRALLKLLLSFYALSLPAYIDSNLMFIRTWLVINYAITVPVLTSTRAKQITCPQTSHSSVFVTRLWLASVRTQRQSNTWIQALLSTEKKCASSGR